jgi:hypothetical protein
MTKDLAALSVHAHEETIPSLDPVELSTVTGGSLGLAAAAAAGVGVGALGVGLLGIGALVKVANAMGQAELG